MPRDIPVSNGHLLVCFDHDYCLRDLYFPHVGQENHLGGSYCRLGLWADGQFSWVGADWRRDLRYEAETLVTRVDLEHKGLGVKLVCRDAVDFHENIFVRQITLENLEPRTREIRLFFSLDLNISGNAVGDTAAFDPQTGGLVHYKGPRYFLANGCVADKAGLDQYATGQKGREGMEGTFRDAEDGLLSGNPIAQGSVDSVIGVKLSLEGGGRGEAYFWIAAAQTWEEVRRLDDLVRQKHPQTLLARTAAYWRLWVRKESPPLARVPEPVGELYQRSLLILTTQIDWQGGILAANDSDVIQYNRDTYSYIWPRDAALAAYALDLAGYRGLSMPFYHFIADRMTPEGYLLHKYNPDGTLASSWHPWFSGGRPQLPIQEDSTALVIWALWHHFVLYRDIEFVKPLYRPLVKAGANFMSQYRDTATGLPGLSYDLWEERRGIFSFTVGAVFGGLTAASLFCKIFGEDDHAEHFRQVAAEIRDAASRHLWREDLGRFCRGLVPTPEGSLAADATCDASLWGLFAFGLYGANDPRLVATMAALREKLWLNTPVGGMARFEADGYYRVNPEVPGNPWVICTLWLADYLLEKGDHDGEVAEAQEILTWVARHARPSGVLAEQLHPDTGAPLSVAPLAWSHAAFVATTHRLLRRLAKDEACPACGVAFMPYLRREDWLEQLYTQTCDSIHGLCKF
jgi:glucoamylase